jgi:hypothetical protein
MSVLERRKNLLQKNEDETIWLALLGSVAVEFFLFEWQRYEEWLELLHLI